MSKMVLLTGGAGFLGSHVATELSSLGYKIYVPRSSQFDLTIKDNVSKVFDIIRPDIVIHLAAKVGGIGANKENPGSFFYNNIIFNSSSYTLSNLCYTFWIVSCK